MSSVEGMNKMIITKIEWNIFVFFWFWIKVIVTDFLRWLQRHTLKIKIIIYHFIIFTVRILGRWRRQPDVAHQKAVSIKLCTKYRFRDGLVLGQNFWPTILFTCSVILISFGKSYAHMYCNMGMYIGNIGMYIGYISYICTLALNHRYIYTPYTVPFISR